MERGGERLRSTESKQKQSGAGGGWSNLSLCLLCEKNCLIFQTGNRVLSDNLLGSC